jgi:TPP-dependent pyruvate/acetoin dehydrogenase alpha subunit
MTFSSDELMTLYTNLVRARQFDRLFAGLISQGKLLGFYHQGEGGEAPGVGACSFLRPDDFVCPHLRGHGLPHMIAKGVDPKYFLAEHTGKATGLCRGMSTYHACAPELGIYGSAGTIGSNFPVSVGYGLACKLNGRGQVVVSCFGDGGSNRGTLHEAFLMTANWKLPVVWVCENNGLAMYVPVEQHHPMENIASLAPGYGMPYEIVDGMDVIAVAEVVQHFVERARAGGGPAFVECQTARYHEHDIGMPDLVGTTPRTAEEIAQLRRRDPITLCQQRLADEGVLNDVLIEEIDRRVAAELEAAEQFAAESPLPDPAVFDQYLYVNRAGGRS